MKSRLEGGREAIFNFRHVQKYGLLQIRMGALGSRGRGFFGGCLNAYVALAARIFFLFRVSGD